VQKKSGKWRSGLKIFRIPCHWSDERAPKFIHPSNVKTQQKKEFTCFGRISQTLVKKWIFKPQIMNFKPDILILNPFLKLCAFSALLCICCISPKKWGGVCDHKVSLLANTGEGKFSRENNVVEKNFAFRNFAKYFSIG
jgi:hypothetical protein